MIKTKLYNLITNREILLYLVFGVLTTLINICTFYIFTNYIFTYLVDENMNIILSNIFAFIFGVTFAFITNKNYVFESESIDKNHMFKQFASFSFARMFTFFVDMIGILLFVNFLLIDKMLSKIFFNIVVIVLNYIFSKYIVFKKKECN